MITGKNGVHAKIVEDTLSEAGQRITTMELRYHRFIHSEFMTHRKFSRNASSSRAVPVFKIIEQTVKDPAIPIHWGKNKPGMQAHEEEINPDLALAYWLVSRDAAVESATRLVELGLHKQVANRLLEPFQFITTLVTATEWDNFFELRISPYAQPEINELALCMQKALKESTPKNKTYHLPYIKEEERHRRGLYELFKISAARCCRISYLKHGGEESSIEEDIARADELIRLKHSSPFEHQAIALLNKNEASRNFDGWRQYRSLIENHAGNWIWMKKTS